MTMRRRTVLAAIGTALTTAGCLGAAEPGNDDGPTASPTDSPIASPTDTPTETPAVACPSFADTDRTVCNHTRSADAEVYLTASSPVFEYSREDDEVETITFTLHNESDDRVGFNPYAWGVKRKTDAGWEHVAPDVYPEPWATVEPGDSYKWVLATETHPTPRGRNKRYPVVEGLGSGLHAFTLAGFLGDGEDPLQVECTALFEAVDTGN